MRGIIPYIERGLTGEHEPTVEQRIHAKANLDKGFDAIWSLVSHEKWESKNPISGSRRHFCAREIAARFAGVPVEEDNTPRRQGYYTKGRVHEAVYRSYALIGGLPDVISPDMEGDEVRYKYDIGGDEWTDLPDVVWREGGVLAVADFKGTGFYGLKEVRKTGTVPSKMDHDGQLHRHMRAVEHTTGEECRVAYYVVIDGGSGQYAQARLDWDQDLWDAMEAAYVLGAEAGRNERPFDPPRPEWATTKEIAGCDQIEAVQCKYCDFRGACWPGFDLVALSKGPEWRRKKEAHV